MKYNQAVILGRFQPLHLGHVHVIEEALKAAKNVLIIVGSSQESRTPNNPFSYEERKVFIQKVFGDKVRICPLKDAGLGNVHAWGNLLVETAEKEVGQIDCFVLGSEAKNNTWFDEEKRSRIDLLEISRADIDISSTKIRDFLKNGNEESFKEFIPINLHEEYEFMKDVISKSI